MLFLKNMEANIAEVEESKSTLEAAIEENEGRLRARLASKERLILRKSLILQYNRKFG